MAEIDRWARLAQFVPEPSDVEWVCRAAANYLDAHGEIPLTRFLRLPHTPAQLRRTWRNRALLAASAQLDPVLGPWSAAVQLEDQLNTFATRGPWRHWCARREAPLDATPMQRALFDVLVLSGGKPLTARQISSVIRNRFIKKFRNDVPMIEASKADDAPRSTKGNGT
jgi:hypothetical protein